MVKGTCIEFTGKQRDSKGYGILHGRRAHRVMYELRKGPISKGLQIHHICRKKTCINPDHMELLTTSEHRKLHLKEDGLKGIVLENTLKTHCPKGHLLDRKWHGIRHCSTCRGKQHKSWYSRLGKAYHDIWREKHRESVNMAAKRYYQTHKEECCRKRREVYLIKKEILSNA